MLMMLMIAIFAAVFRLSMPDAAIIFLHCRRSDCLFLFIFFTPSLFSLLSCRFARHADMMRAIQS